MKRFVQTVESPLMVLISVLLVLGLFLPMLRDWWTFDDRPPVTTFVSTTAITSRVHPGDLLRVRIEREKVRGDCPVTSERAAVEVVGPGEPQRIVDLADAMWVGGRADTNELIYDYPIPLSMPPGTYDLSVNLIYRCPGLPPFHYVQPPARFQVVPRGVPLHDGRGRL